MTPTLVDIARETKTSVSTVSRVLAGGDVALRISADTRERVAEAARRLGYRPNLLARSLRTRKSYSVALILPDISQSYFARVAKIIEQALHQQGYSLMLCNAGDDEALERQYLDMLPRKGVDGMIVVPHASTAEKLNEFVSSPVPVVVLDRRVDGTPSVYSDLPKGIKQLSDALHKAAVKKILLLTPLQNLNGHRERALLIEKHFEVVKRVDVDLDPASKFSLASATRGVACDAVFCTGPCGAEMYLASQSQLDPSRPIVAFDAGSALMSVPTPVISCDQDAQGLAEGVMRQLLPQLRGEKPDELHISVPTQLRMNPAMVHRS